MSKLLELPANTRGRDFVCGDIHGCFDELDAALARLRFNPAADRLISVGDLVDRGPRSADALKYLRQPWLYAVMGNHEQMAALALLTGDKTMWTRWWSNGGGWALEATDDMLSAFVHAVEALPLAIELQTTQGDPVVIVHAELPEQPWVQTRACLQQMPPRLLHDDNEPLVQFLLWQRQGVLQQQGHSIAGVRHAFYGHNVVNELMTLGNRSYIDLGCYATGTLAVIDIADWLLQH
jgi:serine/threonine protein phosphatase 1